MRISEVYEFLGNIERILHHNCLQGKIYGKLCWTCMSNNNIMVVLLFLNLHLCTR